MRACLVDQWFEVALMLCRLELSIRLLDVLLGVLASLNSAKEVETLVTMGHMS